MTTLGEALQFPFKDKFWARRLLIGGILLPIPFICFFPIGYLMRYFHSYLKNHKVDRLPEWDDLPVILSHGVFACIIFLGYLVIPFIFFALGVKVLGPTVGQQTFAIFLWFVSVIIGIWFLSYLPMGLAAYLETGTLKSAFEKKVLYHNISKISTQYYHNFILAIFLFFLAGSSPFTSFYLLLVMCELFGRSMQPLFTPAAVPEMVTDEELAPENNENTEHTGESGDSGE